MELITGKTGQQHVFAQDDAEIYKQILGMGDYVLPTGNKLSATMLSPTQIRIDNGSLVSQGRLAKIRPLSGSDTLSIDTGNIGYKRVDIVVAEYSVNSNGIESMITKVVKGTPSANMYVSPTLTTGNIDNGDVHQVPLWEVRLDGINVNSLVDRRTVLSNSAVEVFLEQALQDRARIEAQYVALQAELNEAIADSRTELTEYADDLAEEIGSKLQGFWRASVSYTEDTTDTITFNVDSGYSYSSTDLFVVSVNGIILTADDYTVSKGTSNSQIKVTLDNIITYSNITNVVELIVIR